MGMARLTAILFLTACAASGGGAPVPAGSRGDVLMPDVRVRGSGNLRYAVDEGRTTHEFEKTTPADVWLQLVSAFQSVGLEPDVIDQPNLVVGVTEVTLTRRLGGERLSRLLSCGTTMTGPLADDARVTLRVDARVYPGDAGLVGLQIRLEATAVPNDAAGGAARQCTSRHVIELRIAEAVEEATGSP